MEIAFYTASVVAVLATVMALTRLNAMHALLYLIVSLLAVAVVFYTLGAPFIAALEVIVYAGSIMVLFIFVVMLLNLGPQSIDQERALLTPSAWIVPAVLSGLLLAEFAYAVSQGGSSSIITPTPVSPKQVGVALYGPYVIGVELASLLLMGALIGAYHLGWRKHINLENPHGRSAD